MTAVCKSFRPEFLNRLDEIIIFEHLSRDMMGDVVDIQLRNLQKYLDNRELTIEVSEAARNYLAERGYDAVYGARPLKRVIQKEIQNELARLILQGKYKDGDVVKIDANEQGIIM